MALILPFLRSSKAGDWTTAERARLARLGERLAPETGADVVFGSTDTGEPWCVVTDSDGEVLIHVARIHGRFVVHDAAADVLEEGAELWSLLLQVLRTPEPAPAPAEIFAFPLQSRQAQTLVALITAAAFLTRTELVALVADTADSPDPGDKGEPAVTLEVVAAPVQVGSGQSPPRSPDAPSSITSLAQAPLPLHPIPLLEEASSARGATGPELETVLAVAAARTWEPAPAALIQVEPTPTPQARPVLAGTSGDDHLVGTAAAEVLLGGEGADTLDGGGAPAGQVDRLNGGAGADTLILSANVIAEGGSGPDRFVLPAEGGRAGVLLDFRTVEGDRLETVDGLTVAVLAAEPTADVLFDFRSTGAEPNGDPASGLLLSLDMDRDGVADTFVLVADPSQNPDPPIDAPVAIDPPDPLGGFVL